MMLNGPLPEGWTVGRWELIATQEDRTAPWLRALESPMDVEEARELVDEGFMLMAQRRAEGPRMHLLGWWRHKRGPVQHFFRSPPPQSVMDGKLTRKLRRDMREKV